MSEIKVLIDQLDRDAAMANHHENIFIDAGAGTGKTQTIVSRIVNRIVANEEFSMQDIAAITFTEKAGAELRNRFRHVLETSKSNLNKSQQERLEEAIVSVDSAAIGTIHSFCKRILTDHSIAAQLPVGFQISSEAAGPNKRVLRARHVADQTMDTMCDSEQRELRDIEFSPKVMQELVTELDSKFAIVNELDLSREISSGPSYQKTVYKFIHTAIGFLKENQLERRNSGEIEFDDLLIMTRDLLAQKEDLRRLVSNQFKVVLVDEFQDTDPIQWQIVRLLTNENKDDLSPKPGSLVLVGDPKQAIYRFRNADIETFIDVKSGFRKGKSDESGFGAIRDLSTNFRSVKPVIQFVNSIFDDSKAGSAHPLYMGVEYKPLDFVHAPDDSAAGPAIRVMEYEAPLVNGKPEKASVELECDWTAKEIRRAITEKYKVTERVGKSGRGYRAEPATFGDVCVLIPVRTKLAELISALSVNGVPFASADPAIVFTRPLVLGLVNSLRVVAQLDDDMAIWAALKSPLFGLTDEQLVKYKQGPGSSWNIDGYAKGNEENVRLAMEVFYDVRTKVGIQSPVRVMQELLEAQRIFEKLSGYENGAFEASALRMVLSHAIQWENDGNTGLLQYAETLEVLSDAKSRTLLPMPDDIGANAVQIMTIHASKGLEFPITVVTCMAGLAQPRSSKILISKAGDIEFYIGKLNDKILIQSAGYSDLKDSEEKPASAQEANRLLYVAMTRAQDHLILSAIRIQSNSRSASLVSALDLLKNSEGFDAAIYESADHTNSTNGELPKGPASKLELIDLKRDFSKEIESSKKRRVVSPSSDFAVEMKVLSSAKQEDVTIVNQIEGNETSLYESDNSSSVVLASRDGRPFGRALHGVMDLVMKHGESPDDETLQRFIWQMASQENCMDDLANLNRKVAMLLASEIVIEALAAEQRWPELHLAIGDPNDEIRLAEGFADLVYKTATGYVLVDYKTDKEITFQSMSHYSQQLGAYGIILEKLTGAAPERILLLHITNDSVETIDL